MVCVRFRAVLAPLLAFISFVLLFIASAPDAMAQAVTNSKYQQPDVFRQLEEILPTPNDFRTASGAPGHKYWQQKVDYDIDVELDDKNQRIIGRETITYTNNSPDTLTYLWLQLDANIFDPKGNGRTSDNAPSLADGISFRGLNSLLTAETFPGQSVITEVKNADTNQDLKFTIVRTSMRIDLPIGLQPGQSTRFSVAWNYNINHSDVIPGRTGCEYFEEDKNYIYEIAQWFPRLCAYSDVTGWQHKEYLGKGEFTLEFGNYVVRIKVPDDHIVASTGELQNPNEVLTEVQRQRLESAKSAVDPVFIVTPDEAKANQAEGTEGSKTWIFKADNVRDFAFASSRKFIWDALGHDSGGKQGHGDVVLPDRG